MYKRQIRQDAASGPHLLRLYNEVGASDLRTFIVGRQREMLEKEPNDSVRKPQVLSRLPVTINGRLEKSGDVDSFAIKVEAGRWLVAMVDAFAIGAPVDAYLHLLDERGVRIALGNDSYNLDPVLAFRIEKTGTYTLQIAGFVHPPKSEVRFTGDKATLYRLTITDGPAVRHVIPVRGESADALQWLGWNLGAPGQDNKEGLVIADRRGLSDASMVHRLRSMPGGEPEQTELEPNNKVEEAQNIAVPGVVNGRLQVPGDEDRFSFTAKAGDRHEFRLAAASLGFPVTAVLRLLDEKGKQLVREDMSVTLQDPKIAWTAEIDGTYILAVSDLYRHGSADSHYRLEARPQIPDFNGATDNQRYRLDPGESIQIKVTVARWFGYDGKLSVTAVDLPPGVTACEVDVPGDKGGEVKVMVTAEKDAPPASQPIRVLVVAEGARPESKAAVFDLRVKNAKTGDPLVTETDNIWLTVPPANTPADAPPAAKKT